MLAIQTTAPRTRKRAMVTEADCALCGGRYTAFRCGLPGAGEYLSAAIAAAGRGAAAYGATDTAAQIAESHGPGAQHLTLAWARRQLGTIKRAAFAAAHGPGACCADMDDDEQIAAALDRDLTDGSADAPF